jgi:hypothetical protein
MSSKKWCGETGESGWGSFHDTPIIHSELLRKSMETLIWIIKSGWICPRLLSSSKLE